MPLDLASSWYYPIKYNLARILISDLWRNTLGRGLWQIALPVCRTWKQGSQSRTEGRTSLWLSSLWVIQREGCIRKVTKSHLLETWTPRTQKQREGDDLGGSSSVWRKPRKPWISWTTAFSLKSGKETNSNSHISNVKEADSVKNGCWQSLASKRGEKLRTGMKAGHLHLGLGGGVQLHSRAGLWAAASPSPDSLSEQLSQLRGPDPAASEPLPTPPQLLEGRMGIQKSFLPISVVRLPVWGIVSFTSKFYLALPWTRVVF